MDEEAKQDAGSQSDEQDLEISVPDPDKTGDDTSQDQEEKEDPSDKLTEDHPRFKNVLQERNQFRTEAEDLRRELEEVRNQTKDNGDELNEEERASLDKIKRELSKEGFVTQSDLRVNQNAQTLRDLNKAHDGKDGLPKFDQADVVAHAKKNGFGDNYEAAYKDMHFDAIVEKNAKALAKAPNPGDSEKPSGGGNGNGPVKKFTESDIANMSDEEYEKYRSGLLTAIKPK